MKLRLIHHLTLAFLTMLPATQAVAGEEQPVRLQSSSKWVVNYADNGCRLLRQFGAGDEMVTLIMNRYGPEDDFQMTLAGKPLRKFFGAREVLVQFGPKEQAQEKEFEEGSLGDVPALIFSYMGVEKIEGYTVADAIARLSAPKEIAPERFAAISYLSVGKKQQAPLILETGALQKPFAALSACTDNLVESWGFDIQKEKTLQRRATPKDNYTSWIRTIDYPTDMLRAGQPAMVQFRLDVDATGAVTACHILETTRPKAFDDAVCHSMVKRANFEPAIDREGKPVASYFRRTVRFRIP
ncbi:hypothetical protein DMP17_07350 [Pseudonocardia sp. TMWB2A]|uniref:energy transducer TonB n=1 Tax=Pseudonocardia sp. TMWB2A TaxID=687430 RepID=UPI00307EDC65